jgi:hypothetical protein
VDWTEKKGTVQVVNHYEETRNSPPRLQMFDEAFNAYRIESGVLWITTMDDATVGYPLDRINQIALDDDASSDPHGGDVATG